MTRWMAVACSLMLMTCDRPCLTYKCNSLVNIPLTTDERAVFDEGDTTAEICADTWCATFTVVAGQTTASTRDSILTLQSNGLELMTVSLTGEKSRDVKLTISRDTVRVEHTWPATKFSFTQDQSRECAQSCVSATVSN